MPVQPVISIEQMVIIVAFIMLLVTLMWFVRRYRGRISGRIHTDRRMHHIEDLALGPQQRLHLIEIDGRCFLVHVGKGHSASFISVDSNSQDVSKVNLTNTQQEAKSSASEAKRRKSEHSKVSTKPKSAFSSAIAQARRNNPALEFGE